MTYLGDWVLRGCGGHLSVLGLIGDTMVSQGASTEELKYLSLLFSVAVIKTVVQSNLGRKH